MTNAKQISSSRAFFAALLLLILPQVAVACDICGAFIGITPYDNQSSIQLLHRYRSFNGYPIANQSHALLPSGAWRLPAGNPGDPSVLHTTNGNTPTEYKATDFEVFRSYELRAKYFIHRRLEVNAFVPFIHNMSRSGDVKDELHDMGDPTVFAAWHVLRRLEDVTIQQRLILGIGTKLQFGRTAMRNASGERYDLLLQPGTGTTDLFLYSSYTAGYKKIGINFNAVGKVNGTNKFNERIGNSVVASLNAFARLPIGANWVVMPSVQSYYEYSKGVFVNKTVQPGTGMNVLMVGAGGEATWKNYGLLLAVHLPVHEQTMNTNLSSAGRIVAGITYSFKQKKYLLGK